MGVPSLGGGRADSSVSSDLTYAFGTGFVWYCLLIHRKCYTIMTLTLPISNFNEKFLLYYNILLYKLYYDLN